MRDEGKTKKQLLADLNRMRQQINELEKGKVEREKAEEALRRSEERYHVFVESLFDTVYQFDLEGKFVYANEAATHMFGYSMDEILNSIRVKDTIEEKDIAVSTRDIAEILKGKSVVGERTFIRRDGTRFVGEVHSGPVYEGEKIVGVRGILRDISERKQIEHNLNERVKELECLYSIARLAEGPDITQNEIYQGVANLLQKSWQYPEITCARIMINDEEFRTANYAETRWKQASSIKVHGAEIGTVEVNYLEARPEIAEGPFLKEKRLLIDAVAEQLGIIIERKLAEEGLAKAKDELELRVKERTEELNALNKRLRSMSQKLYMAQIQEQRRIATLLHDSVKQNLAFCAMKLNKLIKEISSAKFDGPLEDILNDIQGVINELRALNFQLSPSMLYEIGLDAALEELTKNIGRAHGIKCILYTDSEASSIANELSILLYRAVNELLINVVKHAKASRITVEILRADNENEMRIIVSDNGVGFDPQIVSGEKSSNGFGLFSIREQLSDFGVRMEAERVKKGSRIVLTLPMESQP